MRAAQLQHQGARQRDKSALSAPPLVAAGVPPRGVVRCSRCVFAAHASALTSASVCSRQNRMSSLAVHGRGGGEVLLGADVIACPPEELAEAEVAVGDDGAHAELRSQRQPLLRAFDRVPNFRQGGIHVSKEPQGIGLARPSLTAPGDLKRPARDSERVVPPAAAEVGIQGRRDPAARR
jgi:hypothetical protein